MVKTPWFSYEIPFHQAAEVGTQKVIQEHSSIGLVVTCDGSFGEIPRNNYIDSEEKTIQELQKQGKPFLVLVNSQKPYKEETVQLVESLQKKYNASVMSVNCEQLRKDDIVRILEKVLYEFPVVQLEFYIPKWVEMLPPSHYLKADLITNIKELLGKVKYVRDISKDNLQMSSSYINKAVIDQIELATGKVKVHLEMDEKYYYEILSDMTGVAITDEYQLIHTMHQAVLDPHLVHIHNHVHL